MKNKIAYSDYIVNELDKINFSEYISEKIDANISYSEYISEQIDDNFMSEEEILAREKSELRLKKMKRIIDDVTDD